MRRLAVAVICWIVLGPSFANGEGRSGQRRQSDDAKPTVRVAALQPKRRPGGRSGDLARILRTTSNALCWRCW